MAKTKINPNQHVWQQ